MRDSGAFSPQGLGLGLLRLAGEHAVQPGGNFLRTIADAVKHPEVLRWLSSIDFRTTGRMCSLAFARQNNQDCGETSSQPYQPIKLQSSPMVYAGNRVPRIAQMIVWLGCIEGTMDCPLAFGKLNPLSLPAILCHDYPNVTPIYRPHGRTWNIHLCLFLLARSLSSFLHLTA